MAYRANDPVHIDNRQDRTQREAKELARAFRELLKMFEGRRVLWEILSWCGTYQSIYSQDPSAMAFRAGQQDLGHRLQAQLAAVDASLFEQMAREARARAQQEAVVEAAVTEGADDGYSRED